MTTTLTHSDFAGQAWNTADFLAGRYKDLILLAVGLKSASNASNKASNKAFDSFKHGKEYIEPLFAAQSTKFAAAGVTHSFGW